MDIASGRYSWRQDKERESEGGKEGERDREVDDRGSGLSRPRRGSPARTAAAVQTHKVRTHRQRTLASSSFVRAPQRKAACGLFTAHAASLASHAGEGRAQNQTGRTRQTDTRGSGGGEGWRRHTARRHNRRDSMPPPPTGRERGREDNNDPAHGQPPPPAAAAAVVVPRLPGVRNCGVGQCGVGVVVVGCRQTATQVPE